MPKWAGYALITDTDLKSLISSCCNGQVSGAAYCNHAVQQAAQRRVQIMSTTASHQPTVLWMLSSFYYSSSSHLQVLIYHEMEVMSILFSAELDNVNSDRVHSSYEKHMYLFLIHKRGRNLWEKSQNDI